MFTKLIGAATLFTAGSLMAGSSTAVGATPVEPFGGESVVSAAGSCGSQEPKDEGKAPAKAKEDKAKEAKEDKAKDGSCGSKDAKKGQKEGSSGKDKKAAPSVADKK